MQAPELQQREGHEAAGPEDAARAARKVWELREQMTQQAAHHRRVSNMAHIPRRLASASAAHLHCRSCDSTQKRQDEGHCVAASFLALRS